MSTQHAKQHPRTFFVTGTDTDAGKTLCSAWLCLHLQRDYWKPIQTGVATETADADRVRTWLGPSKQDQVHESAITLQYPASPADAADREGYTLDLNAISWPKTTRGLIVEGAGGVMVPLTHDMLLIDWVTTLHIPTVVIAASRLGAINHALLTLEALKNRHIPVRGVILSGPTYPGCANAIEKLSGIEVLDHVPHFNELTTEALRSYTPSERIMTL